MVRNKVSARHIKSSNVAQVGTVGGHLVFNNAGRGEKFWILTAVMALSFIVTTVVWRADSPRTREIAGKPRAAFSMPYQAGATTTSTPTAASPTSAPDPQKALAPLDVAVTEFVPTTCKNGQVTPNTDAKEIAASPSANSVLPGAALGDGGQVRITVQGRHDTAVVLNSVRVEIVSRHPAMEGIYLTGICGSSVKPRFFDVDLSQRGPVAVPKPGRDGGTEFPAVSFPYTVSATDPEVFVFTGISPDEDVEWRLHLLWSSAGEMREMPIDLNGKPFRTTSTKAAKPWCWTYNGINGRGGWVPPDKAKRTVDMCP